MKTIILISPSAPLGQHFSEEDALNLMSRPKNGGWKYKDAALQAAHDDKAAKAQADADKIIDDAKKADLAERTAARIAEQTQKEDAANAIADTGIVKESIKETSNTKGGPASGKT